MKSWRQAIYAMQSIDSLAGGLVGIFVPIYFLTLGYTLNQIFYWFIFDASATLVLFFIAARFVQRFGFIKTMFLRLLVLLLSLVFLYNLAFLSWSFYLIGFLFAAQKAFYWFSIHVIFAKSVEDESIGAQVGNLHALPMLVGLAVPLLGAVITTLLGFKVLFIISGLFYLVSVIPLIYVRDLKINVTISLRVIFDYCKRYKQYFAYEVLLNAIGEIELWLLPIFVYITFKNILSIGAISTFAGLGAAIFTFFVGRFSDKVSKKKILRLGVLTMIGIWLARYMVTSEFSFYILSVLAGFFLVMVTVPFTSIIYKNAKENNIEDFIIFREIPVAIGRVLIFVVALFISSKINISFILAALSYLLILFV